MVAVFTGLMGLAIAGVWTRDILAGELVDLSQGLFRARDAESGTLFWPHWLAEYGTAGALLASAVGLVLDSSWAIGAALAALGALVYTSTNALGWALARRERYAYAVPMVTGALGGFTCLALLLSR